MGSKKTKTIDLSQTEEGKTESPKKKTPEKKEEVNWQEVYSDLSTRTANALREARIKPDKLRTMSDGEITAVDGVGDKGLEEIRDKYPADIMDKAEGDAPKKEKKSEEGPRPANKRHLHRGSKRFQSVTTKVEKGKLYPLDEAISLVKETNIARFNATITAHLVLKERQARVEVTFPHETGKKKKVVIATDDLIKKIDKGEVDFDTLITTPDMMPKLAKYAKVLGPRGLMPSPKTGTITDNPEAKKKELEGGKILAKAEAKAPLMHTVIGKVEQDQKELSENFNALVQAVGPRNIIKATLASTMSPGVKVLIER